jgi:hypothetical protein
LTPNESEEPKGFQVRDRRRFTETGELRGDAAPEAAEEEPAPGPEPSRPASEPRPEAARPPVEISFGTFLMSLSTQALMYLGEIPNPATGKTETDLAAARELVDIVGMLKDKTRGNLDPGESQLIEQILYDLRMHYVEKARG